MSYRYSRVAAVSGSNKGIGLAIVRQLALQYPRSSFNNGRLLIYLAARDQGRGRAAVEELLEDKQLTAAKALGSSGGLADIEYAQLDISSSESIEKFADLLKQRHGQIDFFVGNAGIALTGFDSDVVHQTLASNYYDTLEATEQILPLIKDGGRLVNVASMSGHLTSKYSQDVKRRFLDAKTVENVTELMQEFEEAVKRGTHGNDWPSAAYSVSKAGVIGMTRAIARREKEKGSSVLVNSCCPGWVVTDMTKGKGTKNVDEGAQTPVMLAIGDIGQTTGEFWQDEKVKSWEQ